MSAKTHSFLVVLKDNISEEESSHLVHLFKNISNVADVTPLTADFNTAIGEARANSKIKDKLIDFVQKEF